MAERDIVEGATFEFAYPFVRDTYEYWDEDGRVEARTWKPGVRFEYVGSGYSEAVCDGVGEQIVTVVSVHKPGRYPTRVFYTRQWESPSGKRFGKRGLRVMTLATFRRLIRGYRHNDVRLLEETEVA